jgi:hypothetical protein
MLARQRRACPLQAGKPQYSDLETLLKSMWEMYISVESEK